MEDNEGQKVQNDGESEEKQQATNVPGIKSTYFDTSSSDSDFEFEFKCEICRKTFSGVKPLRQHEKSGQHLKRVRKKAAEEKLARELEEDSEEENREDELDPKPFAVCNTCKKDFTGPESLEQHLKSRNHMKKTATSRLLKEIKDEDGNISLEKLKKKREGKTNKNAIPLVVGKLSVSRSQSDDPEHSEEDGACGCSGPSKTPDDSNDEDTITETHEFECMDCKKVFTGVNPWYQHLISKLHEKTLKQKELFDQLGIISSMAEECSADRYLVQEDDDVIVCRLCTVVFSGPESASAHLKSKKHTKNLEVKKWKQTMKEERKKEKSSSMKTKSTFESSSENNSGVKSETHEHETTAINTNHQKDTHSSPTIREHQYLESSNVKGCLSEARDKPDLHAVNGDELKNQPLTPPILVNGENVNPDEPTLQSFQETYI